MENDRINMFCATCNVRFDGKSTTKLCVSTQCGHIFHDSLECTVGKCNICDTLVANYQSFDDELSYSSEKEVDSLLQTHNNKLSQKNNQNFIDIASISRYPNKYSLWRKFVGVIRCIRLFFPIMGLLARICVDNIGCCCCKLINENYLRNLNAKFLEVINVNTTVTNEHKLEDDTKRIIVCNHTNYHDFFCMVAISDMGFVASSKIFENFIGRAFADIIPHVAVNNVSNDPLNVKKSGIENIKNFFEDDTHNYNKLVVCPEGMLTGTSYITRFRSGAFNSGYPVQPIVYKYKQDVFNLQGFDIVCNERIDVNMIVLDIQHTDGSHESIEKIREEMAIVGDLKKSRIDNRKNQDIINLKFQQL